MQAREAALLFGIFHPAPCAGGSQARMTSREFFLRLPSYEHAVRQSYSNPARILSAAFRKYSDTYFSPLSLDGWGEGVGRAVVPRGPLTPALSHVYRLGR